MQVKLRTGWFVDGMRFRKGRVEIPDHLIDRLPTTAQILGDAPDSVVPAPSEPSPFDGDNRPKMYAGVQPHFKSDSGANVTKDEVLRTSFNEFIVESPGNDIDAWNSLTQDERKERMKKTADNILKTL